MNHPPIGFGTKVTTCDCLMTGRVNGIWVLHLKPRPKTYYRVQFPPLSPFIDDWAIYREGEIAPRVDNPPLTNVNPSIVDAMRPKTP